MTKTLEERVRQMEDILEITNLKSRYLNGCDGGWDRPSHNADVVASTFTEDARWEAQGLAPLHGREAIRDAFKTFSAKAPFAFHCVTNPLIEIEGESAVGEWRLAEDVTDAHGNEFCAAGIYTDRFVRREGRWLIKSLSLTYAYNGPFKDGWSRAIRR